MNATMEDGDNHQRPDGGHLTYIANPKAAIEDFDIEEDENLLVAVDPDGRIVGMVVVPDPSRGRSMLSMTEVAVCTGLETLLDAHTYGGIVGPLEVADSAGGAS